MAQIVLSASTLPSLDEALALVEQRLQSWASNSSAYAGLLQQVFAAAGTVPSTWGQAAATLQSNLLGNGVAIRLELLDGVELPGLNGAYRASGGERIYLNASWLQTATAAEVEAVLLEEIGHAFDARLNGNADSPGDEGERFSALIRGLVPTEASFSEIDQKQLLPDGHTLTIEASDTTAPVAITRMPAFGTPQSNLFRIAWAREAQFETMLDIDNDGDLDLFADVGLFMQPVFLRNTASPGSTAPAFAAPVFYPFGMWLGIPEPPIIETGSYTQSSSACFVDIDGDGDLDAFISLRTYYGFGGTLFFRNTAFAGSTVPAYSGRLDLPSGLGDRDLSTSPTFADIDQDGDLDAFWGEGGGDTYFAENTGSSVAPAFASGSSNPFGITNVGLNSRPYVGDVDGDGDLDLFIGNNAGDVHFFLNTATPGATAPVYAAASINPFGITNTGGNAAPAFSDSDGDGDLDLYLGGPFFFQNTAPVHGVTSTNANGTYLIGDEITLTITFSETVFVTGTPRLWLETGQTDRFASFTGGSGTPTLHFTYTVQPGDTSADLDLLSSSALTLNGGSIQDAAGNNALLTLAAPGGPNSLGFRKNLAIAGEITGVSSLSPSGSYPLGSVIEISISYSEIVNVTGSPRLKLSAGQPDRFATYARGSGSTSLIFSYTVQPGDRTSDLDVFSAFALSLNGGSIRYQSGNEASLRLPSPGGPGSLGGNRDLLVDGIVPVAVSREASFGTAIRNPFGIPSSILFDAKGSHKFVDIDGDGDLDSFTGAKYGSIGFLRNTAPLGSGTASFTAEATAFGLEVTTEPFPPLSRSSPEFGDIDGDGDLDAFIGDAASNILFFRNTAGSGSSKPEFATVQVNPFGLSQGNTSGGLQLIDIDSDGDLDALTSTAQGDVLFFQNTAAAGSRIPAFASAVTNPFGLTNVGTWGNPEFADIDADGDLDAFITNLSGTTYFLRNTAAPGNSLPSFSAASSSPFGLEQVETTYPPFPDGINFRAAPSLVDIDGDGDLDVFISDEYGTVSFFRNTTPLLGLNSTTPNGSYKVGDVVRLTLTFSEIVFVSGIPRIQLETGSIDRFAVYTAGSGSNILIFSYTVQPGDHTADLDQLSSSALSLNGGSIRDAAGNNADLTLAAPGSPGSLRSRKNLVVDNSPPTITEGPLAGNISSIRLTTDEAVIAELLPSTGPALLRRSLAANTSTLINVSARAVVTTVSLVVTDRAGNRTIASTRVKFGTSSADTLNGEEDARPDRSELLFGFAGNDTLNGLSGNDILDGGSGNDSLNGGTGSDTYSFDTGSQLGTDTIVDTTVGGSDTLDFSATDARAIAIDLASNQQQPLVVNAGLSLVFAPGTRIENVIGGSGNDSITGNLLNNALRGGGGNDTLTGLGGNDSLDGGADHDTYSFDADAALGHDTLLDTARSGNDHLDFSTTTTRSIVVDLRRTSPQIINAGLTLTLSAGTLIENASGGAMRDKLSGNLLDNSLHGFSGNDTLIGLTGADTLTGGDGNDLLMGGNGNDSLIGGAGNDTLDGGADDDIYAFDTDSLLGSDILIDNTTSGSDRLDFSATTTRNVAVDLRRTSTQLINAGLSLTLAPGSRIEHVSGGALNDTITGNLLDNDLQGAAGNDTLNGQSGNDSLHGGDGNDLLIGAAGNDTLIGGAGNDSVDGGDDNDTYSFDTDFMLGNDTLIDSTSTGMDSIDFSATTTRNLAIDLRLTTAQVINAGLTLSIAAGSRIENVSGGSLDDTISGNTLNNYLQGGNGNDSILGFSGDDTLEASDGNDVLDGGVGNDALIGGSGNDALGGGAGNDILIGGAGDDQLDGGAGNDTYRFNNDTALGSDTIVDTSVVGTDILDFSAASARTINIDLSLTTPQVIIRSVPALTLTITSGSRIETCIGSNSADTIKGNLFGNTLEGRGGRDSLDGSSGNDVVDGGDDNDLLIGGAGNDTLIGGTGADLFRFDTLPSATTNRDTITDFSTEEGDRIELENRVFTALPTLGTLAASAFFVGDSATTASHRILYNNATGLLAYDADGIGASAAIGFATLTPGLALTHANFTVS